MVAISGDATIGQTSSREALWFYVIACAFSWAVWMPVTLEGLGFTNWLEPYDPEWFYKIAYARGLNDIDWLTVTGGLGPILAAVLVTWRYRGGAGVRSLFARALPVNVGFHWYVFTIPATILLAWLLNSTSGSIFVCMLMHAVNNSAVRLFNHSDDAGLWVRVGVWLLAFAVIVAFGAKDLSRKPRFVLR